MYMNFTRYEKIITRQFCTSIPTPAYIINIIEQQAQDDNMPIGIAFKPKDKSYTHLWLAGVESDVDNKDQMESDINNELYSKDQNNDQTNQENMDINKIDLTRTI